VKVRPSLFLTVVAAVCLPAAGRPQQGPPRVRREIRGFDFRQDGVWRREARTVRNARRRLLGRRNFPALNAPLAAGGSVPPSAGGPLATAAAVSGVLRVPAVLLKFKNTATSETRTTSEFDQVLFASSPTGASAGRPYTYASYYAQLSNGLLSVQGATYGYASLDSNEVTYTGVAGSCSGNPYSTTDCNGLFSGDAIARMQNGLTQALRRVDAQVDWTQYDNNGDGYVDLVAFLQPALDGACGPAGNNHLWSHRYFLLSPYTTHSVNSQGVRIKVADYILESAVGGAEGCDTTQIMPVGTVAHETGHGFGLPDLYDTDGKSEGIGEYSLMGSGNYTSPFSPSRMDAWSLSELGWVTVVPIASGSVYAFGPAPTSDTAFFLPVSGANPRGEYFLLENRQGVESDSAMLRYHCQVWYHAAAPPAGCGGGLLIYHVDSQQIAQHGFEQDNRVNAGTLHGVEVMQADGFGNLDANPSSAACPRAPISSTCADRGDAGDPYPGATGNTAFTPTSTPAAIRNADGLAAGFLVQQIQQLAANGPIQFQLTYPDWIVRAADTVAVIQFDGVSYHLFRDILTAGSVHAVSVADTQYAAAGRTRYVFGSWSGGQARSFTYSAGASPETLTVTLARSNEVAFTETSGGTVSGPVASGTFVTEGAPVTLTATDTSAATGFLTWAGDTVSKSATITLPMSRPYTVRAMFLPPLSTADVVAQLLSGTSAVTAVQLADLDQLGNNNGAFDVGDFLAWVQATGAPLTAQQRAPVGVRKTRGAAR